MRNTYFATFHIRDRSRIMKFIIVAVCILILASFGNCRSYDDDGNSRERGRRAFSSESSSEDYDSREDHKIRRVNKGHHITKKNGKRGQENIEVHVHASVPAEHHHHHEMGMVNGKDKGKRFSDLSTSHKRKKHHRKSHKRFEESPEQDRSSEEMDRSPEVSHSGHGQGRGFGRKTSEGKDGDQPAEGGEEEGGDGDATDNPNEPNGNGPGDDGPEDDGPPGTESSVDGPSIGPEGDDEPEAGTSTTGGGKGDGGGGGGGKWGKRKKGVGGGGKGGKGHGRGKGKGKGHGWGKFKGKLGEGGGKLKKMFGNMMGKMKGGGAWKGGRGGKKGRKDGDKPGPDGDAAAEK